MIFLAIAATTVLETACGESGGDNTPSMPDKPSTPDEPEQPGTGNQWNPGHWSGNWMQWSFAKGADVSYVTQMEDEGYKFHHIDGTDDDLMNILKLDCGVNAIRLRVWVDPKPMNPATGKIYNNLADVLAKAERAAALNLQIMIDFHFSDYWADPGKQWIPDAWKNYSKEQLMQAMTAHINEVLNALKAKNISPRWVQLGNEVTWGMMWDPAYSPDNQNKSDISGQPADGDDYSQQRDRNFADYIQTAYNAVKAIDPTICTIVHITNAYESYWDGYGAWIFNILRFYNVDYDMIGLSLYPTQAAGYKAADLLTKYVNPAIDNAKKLSADYGRPIMFAEVGMPWDDPTGAANMIQTIMNAAKSDSNLRGIFYWEPEANPYWEAEGNGSHGYTLGGFDPNTNSPTQALSPFLNNID